MKRALISLVVGAALAVAPLSALAADPTNTDAATTTGHLAPGNAAGVKEAQGLANIPLIFWLGAGLVITAAILAVSNNNDNSTPAATTTSTAP